MYKEWLCKTYGAIQNHGTTTYFESHFQHIRTRNTHLMYCIIHNAAINATICYRHYIFPTRCQGLQVGASTRMVSRYVRAGLFGNCVANQKSKAELRDTIKIIWTGDDALRTYYNAAARRRAPALPGLPAQRPVLPMYPFLPVDAVQAHNTRTMPVERNAAGLPIPPVAGAGPVPAPAPAPAPGHPPAAAQAPVIAPAANRQVHSYPFSFWPAQPWHMEPQNDLTLDMNVADMNVADMNAADANRNRWLNTNIYLWPTGNDGNWHGCKVLGSGSHGCAGLWCRVDENDNIIEASREHLRCGEEIANNTASARLSRRQRSQPSTGVIPYNGATDSQWKFISTARLTVFNRQLAADIKI
jgi:hypothetical protein